MALLDRLGSYIKTRTAREFVVFQVVIIGFSVSIVYSNVQTFDPAQAVSSGYSDTIDYMNMYRGELGTGNRAYRPLVPALARLVPDPPTALYNERPGVAGESADSETRRIALKFGLVNLMFLIGCCTALYVLLRDFGYGARQGFLGVLLFLSNQAVIRSAGYPMSDPAFFFFFLVCLIGLLRNKTWTVLLSATIGVLAKELIVLAAPLALITRHGWRSRLRLFTAVLPAFLVYALVRATSGTPPNTYGIQEALQFKEQMKVIPTANGALNLFMAFGLAWVPAIYALFTGDIPAAVRRWLWLVPLVLLGVLLAGGNLGRGTFSAFPVVIPLAVSGLTTWALHAMPGRTRRGELGRETGEPSPAGGL